MLSPDGLARITDRQTGLFFILGFNTIYYRINKLNFRLVVVELSHLVLFHSINYTHDQIHIILIAGIFIDDYGAGLKSIWSMRQFSNT